MKKTTSQKFSQRLAHYGALSLAIAGVTDASGQIIYTDVDPDFGGQNVFYSLDLDDNGEIDFGIVQYSTFGALSDKNAVRMFPIQYFVGSGNAVLANNVYATPSFSFAYPLVLNTNDPISSGNSAWNSNYQSMDFAYGVCYANSAWCGETDKYIGLRFLIGVNTHYGWARLDVNDSTNWLIKEYAYNSTPDAPINAGQTVLGIEDNLLSKIKVVALNKSIGLYNLPERSSYNIFSMTGQEVLNGSTNQRDYVIEVPTLASGVYLLELTDTNSKGVIRKKVVLQ